MGTNYLRFDWFVPTFGTAVLKGLTLTININTRYLELCVGVKSEVCEIVATGLILPGMLLILVLQEAAQESGGK